MKKFILGLIAAITVATIAYAAGPTVLTALTLTGNLIVGGTVTSTGVIAGEIASQADTNVTTTATSYTPAARVDAEYPADDTAEMCLRSKVVPTSPAYH